MSTESTKAAAPIAVAAHDELSQLQVTVRHLLDAWPAVLQRREFLRRMAQSEPLRDAFANTYAGHVFNAMHGAMSADLVRNIGALILDRDRRSASVSRAVHMLRKPTVIQQLRERVYGVIPPVAGASPEASTMMGQIRRSECEAALAGLPTELAEIDSTVLNAPLVGIIEDIRNKMVAHTAVERDGSEWKVWAIGGRLTYAQLDEYIDACTKAVDKLSHRVLRHAYPFNVQPEVNQRYVDEFIEALVIGLTEQKQAKERKREEILRRYSAGR